MLNLETNKKTKKLTVLLLFFSIIMFSFGGVLAETISGGDVFVESGETLEKTSFLTGNNIRVDGDINGTTFATGFSVEINGNIDGDLFVSGQNIIINGNITGSVFTASQNITINGNVENNIYLAGGTLKIKSQNNGSAFLAGESIYIEDGATIGKDAFIGASKAYQNGTINGDLTSASDSLSVGGKIDGDLNYKSKNKADFINDSEVKGETTWEQIESKTPKSIFSLFTLYRIVFSILASLVVWLVVRLIRPTFWIDLAKKISIYPLKTIGYGVLSLLLIPIVSVILMITVIGIPLSLILLSLYAISIYISKIIISIFIGSLFKEKFNWSNAQAFWIFLLVLIILSVLGIVPIVRWILSFAIVSFGLGSIVLSIKEV